MLKNLSIFILLVMGALVAGLTSIFLYALYFAVTITTNVLTVAVKSIAAVGIFLFFMTCLLGDKVRGVKKQ